MSYYGASVAVAGEIIVDWSTLDGDSLYIIIINQDLLPSNIYIIHKLCS